MSPLQIAVKIRDLLAARKWGGVAANEVVFGSVVITARDQQVQLANMRLPAALVQIGSNTADDEEPGFLRQDFSIIIVQAVAGDETGQGGIVGQNRTGGTTTSRGRGLGEIEPEMKTVIRDLGNVNAVDLLFVSAMDASASQISETGHVVYRQYTFRAFCVTDAA